MIFFKRFYPNKTRKKFFKELFREVIDVRILLLIIFIQVALFVISLVVLSLVKNITISSMLETSLVTLTASFFINLISGPIGEEPGWRGFFLQELTKRKGFVKASILNGFLWGMQHLPLWFTMGYSPLKLLFYAVSFVVAITSATVVMGYIFLKKRNLIRELKHLSHTDVATGARNRLAMYDYFKTLTNKKDIGVVFCDITGLKNTNDTQGHSAGDELIKNTYYCLKEEFADESIFRIGGDEFVIICDGIIEEVFNKKINDLRKTFNDKKMIVAIGTECRDRVAENVKKTIINAENKMYEEKNEWYKNNGDKANRR